MNNKLLRVMSIPLTLAMIIIAFATYALAGNGNEIVATVLMSAVLLILCLIGYNACLMRPKLKNR